VESEPDGMLAYALAIANPTRDDPNWPLPSFDAKDWAEAFCQIISDGRAIDEDFMVTWFANALMRGYDEAAQRRSKDLDEARSEALRLRATLGELTNVDIAVWANKIDDVAIEMRRDLRAKIRAALANTTLT
jgi:hypothetical protein